MARALLGLVFAAVALPLSFNDTVDAQVAADLIDLPFSIDESLLGELLAPEPGKAAGGPRALELLRQAFHLNLTRAEETGGSHPWPHRGHRRHLRGADDPDDTPANGLQKRPLVWVHLHKAGGTLMCKMAKKNENVIQPSTNCNWEGHDGWINSGDPAVRRSCSDRAKMFRLNGYTYGHIEREMGDFELCDKFRYGIMFREPLALMQSVVDFELWFQTTIEHTAYSEPFLKFPADVAEWLRGKIAAKAVPLNERKPWVWLDNFQTRILANALDVPAGQINKDHLTRARALLQKHNFTVQVLEDLPNQGEKLFNELGWTWYEGALKRKPNSIHEILEGFPMARAEERSFTPAEEEYLRRLNQYDLALYNGARDPSFKDPVFRELPEPRAEPPAESQAEQPAEPQIEPQAQPQAQPQAEPSAQPPAQPPAEPPAKQPAERRAESARPHPRRVIHHKRRPRKEPPAAHPAGMVFAATSTAASDLLTTG